MKLNLHSKNVLDERELQEMYRVEHLGLWLMYGLLFAAVVMQALMGAKLPQIAGELGVLIVTSVVMIIANVRRGIWDQSSRPSVKGNAACSLGAGAAAVLMLGAISRNMAAALFAGAAAGVLCFLALTALMRYMLKKQAKREAELETELETESENE